MSKDEKLRLLKTEAESCKRCRLRESRSNVVFGVGPADARVMLVGEGPGATEDRTQIPFAGAAGKFLNGLLEKAGLKREEVYITNVVLSRPPDNRAPLPDEIETCRPFLQGQISIIKPKLVVALGRTAAAELMGRNVVMAEDHGKLLDREYAGVKFKLYVTYHPAAALYGASAKQKLLEDFTKLRQLL
ncbi:MAG: uracil-DNA glycosylase [Candidatus Hadarchaeota archaeon]